MDVLIVGAGAMGTWFGDTIEATVTFADVDETAAARAAETVDGAVTDIDGDDRYDAVCLAVPMTIVTEAVEAHAHRAERAILDVSGVMKEPIDAMRTHLPDRERVSLHPLFAPARAPGSIPVVADQSGSTTDAILADLDAAGNDLVTTTPTEHDDAMESVQAKTHAAVLSFALAAERVPEGFETPIYENLRRLAEQVTEGTPRVYADVQRAYEGSEDVAAAAARIARADHDDLEELYATAVDRWHDAGSIDDRSHEARASDSSDGRSTGEHE